MEFWFSIVKILAILAMIGFGSYLLATGTAGIIPVFLTFGHWAVSSHLVLKAWLWQWL